MLFLFFSVTPLAMSYISMDFIHIGCPETKMLSLSNINSVNINLLFCDSHWLPLGKHWFYGIPKGQYNNTKCNLSLGWGGISCMFVASTLISKISGRTQFQKLNSCARVQQMVQFILGHSFLTLWHYCNSYRIKIHTYTRLYSHSRMV